MTESSLESGTNIGRYKILSKIGAGGMGEVYRAFDPRLNREVAIKVLPASFSNNEERLRRFELEAQAAGALRHPNILGIYDVNTHDGSPYVVSELLVGETLRDAMDAGPIPLDKVIDYALQIVRGLSAAHEKGIIHRDIKPENLFVQNDGQLKILDFGLAKLIEDDVDDGEVSDDSPTVRVKTDTGTVIGTVGYMSPEQLRGKTIDQRTDIFSFGVVLYEMLYREKAFRRGTPADTIAAVLREDPRAPSDKTRDVSPYLDRIVRRCIEKNREQRFHSASDLAFALSSLVSNQTSGRNAIDTSQSSQPFQALPPRRYRWFGWIAAGIIAGLAVVIAGKYFQGKETGNAPMQLSIEVPEKMSFGPSVAFSPDGKLLAFTATDRYGIRTLWVRPLDSSTPRQLTSTEDAQFPFWSPDSKFIGFFASKKLKKIEAAGGQPEILAEVSTDPRGGCWGRDGTILYTPSIDQPLFSISAGGGASKPVTALDRSRSETSHRWPSFLPDGRHFIYFARGSQKDLEGIFVNSLDSDQPKFLFRSRLLAAFVPSARGQNEGFILAIRDGSLIAMPFDPTRFEIAGEGRTLVGKVLNNAGESGATALASFSASANGHVAFLSGDNQTTQLRLVDRTGKILGVLGQPAIYHDISLSPDRSMIAVAREDEGTQDIWMIDVNSGASTRLTFDPAPDVFPVWSVNGDKIIFVSGRTGTNSILQRPASGTGADEMLLPTNGKNAYTLDVSPDGKYILYEIGDGVNNSVDMWLIPTSGDRTPIAYMQTAASESDGRFSPDGKWLAYVSDESGRPEIYVRSFSGSGGKWQVTTEGGIQPMWRRDGKELYYVDPDKNLTAVKVDSSSAIPFGDHENLFQISFPANNPWRARNRYVPMDTGQKFLVNDAADGASRLPMTLILNWQSGLK